MLPLCYAAPQPNLLGNFFIFSSLGGDLCERTSSKDYVLTEHKCRTIVRQICRGKKMFMSCQTDVSAYQDFLALSLSLSLSLSHLPTFDLELMRLLAGFIGICFVLNERKTWH